MKYRMYNIDRKTTITLGGSDVYILPSFTTCLDGDYLCIFFGFLWFAINIDIYFNPKS